jgi:hypothetical protein
MQLAQAAVLVVVPREVKLSAMITRGFEKTYLRRVLIDNIPENSSPVSLFLRAESKARRITIYNVIGFQKLPPCGSDARSPI